MKLSLRLISCLVFSVCVVTFVVARNQVRAEQSGLRADIARRGEILTESLQENIESALQKPSTSQLRRIVDRFDDRQHLAGVAVYDHSGTLLAASDKLGHRADAPPSAVFAESLAEDQGAGEFATLGSTPMYVYSVPVHYGTNGSGVLVTFHDASYIAAQSARIWREALWHVVAEVLLMALITILIVRSTIVGPITKMSQWMKDLRAGRIGPLPHSLPDDFLQPLSSEAASLARSLTEARLAANEEARLRDAGDTLWTAERLQAGVRRRLRGNPLFLVSNREPYQHVHGNSGIEVRIPASGLVTALEPILRACDGTWIAHGSANADRETVDSHDRLRVPPDQPHYTLRRVWLSQEEENGYYFGFANEGLWPLCHIAHIRPSFRATDWEHYRGVNEKFAGAVLDEIADAERPCVLIQDYHFALLPRIITAARPDARVAIFWHIPWPNAEAFGICPWQAELLDGLLLGADLVGFHIQAHCNNFLETVDHSIECRIEWERFAVNRSGHLTLVRPLPISVALPRTDAGNASVAQRCRQPKRHSGQPGSGSRVLRGREWIGWITPRASSSASAASSAFSRKISALLRPFCVCSNRRAQPHEHRRAITTCSPPCRPRAQRINARFQDGRWKPIVFHNRHHGHEEIEPFYRSADLCLVTSLHDGMNLVAKEFVAARTNETGVLILSQFTGACRELRDALVVNPYDVEQVADSILRALQMPSEEQRARMRVMRSTIKEHNVYRWAADLISEVAEIRLDASELAETR